MTPGRVLWLIEQLPEGSAFVASQKGGLEHRAWTADRVLLAGIFNALAAANYQRGNGKGKKPKPIEPPTVSRKGQRAGRGRSKAAAYIARGIRAAKSYATPDPQGRPSTEP